MNNWSLMDHGAWLGNPEGSSPAHLCAWSKIKLGWITPQEITSKDPFCGLSREVWAIETSKESLFKLPTANQGEYFLVSNRHRTGFDSYLPGEGILIWHIDDKVGLNNPRTNPSYPPYWVYLEQADGRNDLSKGGPADEGNPYSSTGANDRFDVNTNPNSRDYSENPTGIEIRVLDPPGEMMTVVMKNNCQEMVTKTYAAANPFIISQHPDGIGIYLEPVASNPTLSIYDLNGQLVHTATGGEKVSRGLNAERKERWASMFPWDGRNDAGRQVASGVYIYIIESEKGAKTGKLAVIR
ncbi:MAG: FlgD immunoglobulin-like domain containing protein [bacterium]|nr:FlgD immunoglobulin-like domain containing protein [bacterium]